MEPNEVNRYNGQQRKKYALGVIIIITGIVLLIEKTGFLPFEIHHIIFSWPMLLIAIGIVSFFSSESRTPGTILIVIGGVFLISRIFEMSFNVMHLGWPLVLIIIGVVILLKRSPGTLFQQRFHRPGNQTMEDGFIHEENIFSGGKQRVIHQVFRGGHINCVFGGSEVDLTQATLGDGVSELEVNTIFGGVTLIVPGDWKIQLKMTSIMGGFADKRSYIKESPDPSKILIIKGSTIFGGGEIKSY